MPYLTIAVLSLLLATSLWSDQTHRAGQEREGSFSAAQCPSDSAGLQSGFSPLYFSQIESTMREAIPLLTRTEKETPVRMLLQERAPDRPEKSEISGVLDPKDSINLEALTLKESVPTSSHGEGTTVVMAGRSPASVWGTDFNPKLTVSRTYGAQPAELLKILQRMKTSGELPAVINVSQASLSLGEGNEDAIITEVYAFACANNILISMGAGNGRPLAPIPVPYQDCVVRTGSLDAVGKHSVRSSSGPNITVSAMSDRYQKVLDERWHGYTSGAAPITSAAVALMKMIWPQMPVAMVRKILESAVEPGWPGEDRNLIGSGRLNIPKAVMLSRLARAGKISASTSNASMAATLTNFLRNNEAPLNGVAARLAVPSKPITSCAELQNQLLSLRAAYFIQSGEEKEKARKALADRYLELGFLHEVVLFSARDSKTGAFLPSPQALSRLLQIPIETLGENEFIKYLDLLKGISLNPEQKKIVLEKLKPLFIKDHGWENDDFKGFGFSRPNSSRTPIYQTLVTWFSSEELAAQGIAEVSKKETKKSL